MPEGKESNWLQTVPGKGWWTILRLYNPLQSFFDKTWRPSEIEPVCHFSLLTSPGSSDGSRHRLGIVNELWHSGGPFLGDP